MADTIIVHAASGGSDTGASGCGPGDGYTSGSALTDTTESTTAEFTTTTNLQIPNSSLTGVAVGHVVYVYGGVSQTRKFFEITAVNNAGTATASVTVTPAGVVESGLNFSIGGKRATLFGTDSAYDEAQPGWVYEFESGYTESTSGRKVFNSGTASARVTYRTKAGYTTKAAFTWTDNLSYVLGAISYLAWHDIKFLNSNATKTQSSLIRHYNSVGLEFVRCEFGDPSDLTGKRWSSLLDLATPNPCQEWTFLHCYFAATSFTIRSQSSDAWFFLGCVFEGCGHVFNSYENIGRFAYAICYRCLFIDCTDYVAGTSGGMQFIFIECTAHNCKGYIESLASASYVYAPTIINCISNDATGYGTVNYPSTSVMGRLLGNISYGHSLGASNNPPANATTEAEITNDPFPSGNDSTDDYEGESNTQGAGFPTTDLGDGVGPGAGNRPYADIGAVNAQRSAGGGGATVYLRGRNSLLRR